MQGYPGTLVPAPYQRHLMNRMGTGYTPATWTQMRRAGGALPWFKAQLQPSSVAENAKAKALPGWYPDLPRDAAQKWEDQATGRKGGWEYARDLECLTILRRAYSRRPILETMADFWANHLHIPAGSDLAWVYRYDYELMLRRMAFGRFDQLLTAATLHPAMLLYLDNWRSMRDAPNENHGRELLELHTVGRSSGYTEDMVKDSAKILSGYTVDAFETWEGYYNNGRHTLGAVKVLGFQHANNSSDGRAVTTAYLKYLAHHPATARNLARKLAVKFVSDTPSADLVADLARVYLNSDTAIRPMLLALVQHPEFKAAIDAKVRNPIEDLVNTIRVLDVSALTPSSPFDDGDYANAIGWAHGGLGLFQWPRPDGAPEDNGAYSSATRMLASFDMHWSQTGGWWPEQRVAYHPASYWLPQRSLRFDEYVDHLSRRFHGRPATKSILTAAAQATGVTAATIVDADHAVADWLGVRLIAVLLDHPRHMSR
jgi:uncharacterized protein (DUF1800 family)